MTAVQRKLIFAAQIVGIVIVGLLLKETRNYTDVIEGYLGIAVMVVGARHMFTIGRPWGWGLLAVTGIGALVILLLPPKPVTA